MDYFNLTEREKQRDFALRRDRFFHRILNFLANKKITPNQLSFAGLICLIAACFFSPKYYIAIILFLLLYCLFDAIDGGLARLTEKASEGGSLVDIVVDQAGPVLLSAAAVVHFSSNPVWAVLFSNSYIAFIALILYANERNIEIGIFIRVKYFFYVMYGLSVLFGMDLVNIFMGLSSVYYIVMIFVLLGRVYEFYKIKTTAEMNDTKK
jgi:phosphatidylglycerophosphate synthase